MIESPYATKLAFSGISLTNARAPKFDFEAFQRVRDEIEPVIVQSEYFRGAPFTWVTLAIRYGLKNEELPHYGVINKKYGDLPLSIEVDVQETRGASLEVLHRIFRSAALRALIHAGEKYGCPVDGLKKLAGE